jgi:hypothetical protein
VLLLPVTSGQLQHLCIPHFCTSRPGKPDDRQSAIQHRPCTKHTHTSSLSTLIHSLYRLVPISNPSRVCTAAQKQLAPLPSLPPAISETPPYPRWARLSVSAHPHPRHLVSKPVDVVLGPALLSPGLSRSLLAVSPPGLDPTRLSLVSCFSAVLSRSRRLPLERHSSGQPQLKEPANNSSPRRVACLSESPACDVDHHMSLSL